MYDDLLETLCLESSVVYSDCKVVDDKLIVLNSNTDSDVVKFNRISEIIELIDEDRYSYEVLDDKIEITQKSVYQIITSSVKKLAVDMDVVFPSTYSKMFSKVAQDLKVDLKDEEIRTNELLDDEVISHVVKLDQSASKAITAIENEDSGALREVLEEAKSLKSEIEKLRDMVYEDALTKVYNRRWFEENYVSEDRFKKSGYMVFVDINNFSNINDKYGRSTGDKVLQYIASRLKRNGDNVVRYDQDRFLLMYDVGISERRVHQNIDTIREFVLSKALKVNDKRFWTSFSYGIVSFSREDRIENTINIAISNMNHDKVVTKKRLSA